MIFVSLVIYVVLTWDFSKEIYGNIGRWLVAAITLIPLLLFFEVAEPKMNSSEVLFWSGMLIVCGVVLRVFWGLLKKARAGRAKSKIIVETWIYYDKKLSWVYNSSENLSDFMERKFGIHYLDSVYGHDSLVRHENVNWLYFEGRNSIPLPFERQSTELTSRMDEEQKKGPYVVVVK